MNSRRTLFSHPLALAAISNLFIQAISSKVAASRPLERLRLTRDPAMVHATKRGNPQFNKGPRVKPYRTPKEKRAAAIKSMLDKGLTPIAHNHYTDLYSLGNHKKVSLMEIYNAQKS
jgi:hypothetical protein